MKKSKVKSQKSKVILLLAFVVFCLSFTAFGQKRDNLTDKEDLQVREAQELDLRVKVYIKIIDRRLLAINNSNAAQDKQVKKDIDSWGEIRTDASKDLYWDIQKTLDEAIRKLDDVAERDTKNPLFSKAVHILADASQKWLPQFRAGLDKTSDEKEKGLILASIDFCQQIIEASSKVAKDDKKKPK
jgi:hypothetical protein